MSLQIIKGKKLLLVANTDWYLYNFRLSLARFLQIKGAEVVMVSPQGRFAPALEASGFRWLNWRVGRSTVAPWLEGYAFWQLAAIYRTEKPDLVHHFTVKPVLYGSLAAKLAGIPTVVNSITGLGYIFEGKEAKANLVKPIARTLYRMALGWTQCEAIFENEFNQAYFIQNHFSTPERSHLIESVGIEVSYFIPSPEPEGTPVIVLPSRMLWDKGVGVLVEAARILKQRTKVRVALVGETDPGNPSTIPQAVIDQWVAEGVVEWWGWQADMREVFAKCHIVTLPSKHEGSATGLLEAASCGRPLVATDIPGCRPFVHEGENGLLVPVNDPPALAAALEQLVLNPILRRRMGNAGRKLVIENYTDEQINQATFDVYEKGFRK